MSMKQYIYHGGCHCQQVRFQISADQSIENSTITLCNCSICDKTGYLHLFIPHELFVLNTPWNKLTTYQFNKRIAQHYFCKTCGIKSFYQPRSHQDCWSINVRCLDNYAELNIAVNHFDGRNWQNSMQSKPGF